MTDDVERLRRDCEAQWEMAAEEREAIRNDIESLRSDIQANTQSAKEVIQIYNDLKGAARVAGGLQRGLIFLTKMSLILVAAYGLLSSFRGPTP